MPLTLLSNFPLYLHSCGELDIFKALGQTLELEVHGFGIPFKDMDYLIPAIAIF